MANAPQRTYLPAIGWAFCIPSVAVAAVCVWSQTARAWADGPQGELADVFEQPWGTAAWALMLMGLAWVVMAIVLALKRRSFGGVTGLAPIALYAMTWGIVMVPQVTWERLFVDRAAHSRHAAAFLIDAAYRGDVITLEALLDHGAPVNATNMAYGNTALHIAAYNGRTAAVRLLLDRGADPNAIGGAGHSALHLALSRGQTEAADLISKRGGRDIPPRCRHIAPTLVDSEELRVWYRVRQDAVDALVAGDFAHLEEVGKKYAQGGTTPAGTSLLWLYHDGLDRLLESECGISKPWTELEAKTETWAQRYPDSPRAIATHARALIGHGWAIRGDGYASDVKEEDWAPFGRYIAQARDYLEAHAAVGKRDPDWYVNMMDVAVAQGWSREEFMRLYDEATTAFPDDFGIYYQALTYFMPKWYGNREEMDGIIRDGARRSALGYALYATAYWWLSDVGEFNELFIDTPAKWPPMKQGFEELVKRYPDPWNINSYARFACKAGDREKTRQLMVRIGNRPLRDAWEGLGLYRQCKEWAEGRAANYYGPSARATP